jgi:hypothetical protein
MIRPQQFSLAYLLAEISLLAIGLGIARWASTEPIAMPTASACFGAAMGGLFGRMKEGAVFGVAAFYLLLFLAL